MFPKSRGTANYLATFVSTLVKYLEQSSSNKAFNYFTYIAPSPTIIGIMQGRGPNEPSTVELTKGGEATPTVWADNSHLDNRRVWLPSVSSRSAVCGLI